MACTLFILLLILDSTLQAPTRCQNENTGTSPTNARRHRPNIVIVMTDSFDGRLTFGPGNLTVQLPFTNYMREHGAVFLNSYTNSPICCPSRAAMWSGKFVHLTESWNNYKCLDENYTTWMDLLQRDGYYTQKLGKVDYKSGDHSLSNRVEAWTRDVDFLLRQEGRPVANLTGDASTVKVMEEDWNETDSAARWIRSAAATLSQPFALYLGLNLPHPYPTPAMGENKGASTFQTSPYWLKKVSRQLITVPKWLPLKEMHQVDYYSTYTKNCSWHFTQEEIKDIRAFYYAMCAEADAMLGEILSALRDAKVLGDTFVIFTSDHGELAMEHRQFYKMSMYEGSSHVPFLLMGPKVEAKQQIAHLISLVDVYPTVLDLSADQEELHNVAAKLPSITASLDKLLRSVVNYPAVSKAVHQYNKQQFISWKSSLGNNYTDVIANLRWHTDWQKDPKNYENAIKKWLQGDL
ncbi:arylsulfatase K-like isoform X2 [Acipenser ruthenus]|uniref:arylsulfatase K-like isoform X2 n=1 Tax=Acipenser ruthenus TaxID=7906 RepID=UPI0027424E49|nr:arylsulfatase K-like isoform X2 [Acipenser ruthenus]